MPARGIQHVDLAVRDRPVLGVLLRATGTSRPLGEVPAPDLPWHRRGHLPRIRRAGLWPTASRRQRLPLLRCRDRTPRVRSRSSGRSRRGVRTLRRCRRQDPVAPRAPLRRGRHRLLRVLRLRSRRHPDRSLLMARLALPHRLTRTSRLIGPRRARGTFLNTRARQYRLLRGRVSRRRRATRVSACLGTGTRRGRSPQP